MEISKLDRYYEKFIEASKLHGEATKKGDFKAVNKQYRFLKKIYKIAEKNPKSALNFYQRLMNSDDASVKGWACVHSLALHINIEIAEEILLEQSNDKSLGILRLDAEMTLKQWRERGYLKA